MFKGIIISCVSIIFSFQSLCFAAPDALQIVKQVDAKNATKSSKSKISMHVYPDMHDNTNRRDFKVLSYSKGDDLSYMEFITPRTITGLRILSIDQDQWVYFPSTGRVRKIAGKSKKKSVKGVGGDFSYEDLSGGTMEARYSFTLLEEQADLYRLEGMPKDKDSAYSKIIMSVDKNSFWATKIEFYTEEDGHYKDMLQTDIKKMSGREMPTTITMINLVKERKTIVKIHAAQYDIPIDEKYFNPQRFDK